MTAPHGGSASAPARGRLTASLVVVLALISGLVLGVAVDRGLLLHRPGSFGLRPGLGSRFDGPRRGPPTERWRHLVDSELGLTPAQIAQVDSIMARQMGQRQALVDTMDARMRVLMDSTRAAVGRVLTPEQRQKLDALRAHRDSARGPRREHRRVE